MRRGGWGEATAAIGPQVVSAPGCSAASGVLRGRSLVGVTVVPVAGLQQTDNAGPPGVKGEAFGLEAPANGAGDAVFVDLADIVEKIAALGAPVVPLLEEFLDPHSVGPEACGPLKPVEASSIVSLPARKPPRYAELVFRPGSGAKM